MLRDTARQFFNDFVITDINSFFEALNVSGNLADCWAIDGIKRSVVRKYATKSSRLLLYKEFEIPKKSGGNRKICAPVDQLKDIQTAISLMLQCWFTPLPCVTGFVEQRSVKDNAMIHVGATCIFNTDLKNFFPSITKAMLRKALFRELSNHIKCRKVVNLICNLCTIPDENGCEVLPQGAPSSPVLSNIVLSELDRRLVRLAKIGRCQYSRYADDLTFSHRRDNWTFAQSRVDKIRDCIESLGFTINEKKTKITTPPQRQEVTGVTVNEKPNVSRLYIKQLRSIMHLWEHYGYDKARSIYISDFCGGIEANIASAINGKINYLAMIKGKDDSTYLTYKRRYRKLLHELKT